MFLSRIIRKVLSLLFPGYAAKKAQREKAEIRALGQQLFPEEKLKAVFPHLKARRQAEAGKWILRAKGRKDACLLLNMLPDMGRTVTEYKPDRILMSVRINRKTTVRWTEYLYPFRTKWKISGKEEVLFARIMIRIGGCTEKIMDFYMDATIFYGKQGRMP